MKKHLAIRCRNRILDKLDIAVIISLIYDIPFPDQLVSDMSYRSLGDMLITALHSSNPLHTENRSLYHYDISNFEFPLYFQ